MNAPTIFEYIKQQEIAYDLEIPINDAWNWNMHEQIKLATLYKNSQFRTGNTQVERDMKPFRNIVRPMLNLRYRAEDIDVKDIILYVDDPDSYHLSFLIKKYHDDVFVLENDIDSYIDELKESKIDFGGALTKKTRDIKPEVVPLESIAFCDQTDILSGPIGIKHFFSPDQLKEMGKVGWGDKVNGATASIDDLIILARKEKTQEKQSNQIAPTPGKYIEIYEIHGNLPQNYLEDDVDPYEEKYVSQIQIVGFYRNDKDIKEGVVLFRKEEKENPFKFVQSDKVYGRALGFGGVEELLDPQVWTNYSEMVKKDMLDSASKTILHTTDGTFGQKHPMGLRALDNLEVIDHMPGTDIAQIDTTPRNMIYFDKAVADWWTHAQTISGATDALLGQTPPSGTPFRLEVLTTQQGQGLHEYRRGKYAKFLEEIYRDWIIPAISRKISEGVTFLSELTQDELRFVTDRIVANEAKRLETERVLNGEQIDTLMTEAYKAKVREEFLRGGNKRFIKILKGEMKKAEIKVKINVAGKQKNLQGMMDKLSNIIRFLFSTYNPQTGGFAALEDPKMSKLMNQIFEYAGLDPISMGEISRTPQMIPQQIMQTQPNMV